MYDVIIIGAGPAGLTAALYAGRYRLSTLILEKTSVGGQIIFTPTIENFPGFPGGISTQELIERFKRQVEELGVRIEREDVLKVKPDLKMKTPFYNVNTENKTYQTKSVIVASGAQPKRLGVKGEEELIGRGVSYCGTCDGPLFKDKDIVVIGGGDRAIEEAIFLSGYAKKVSLIHRRQSLRASKILEERVKNNPKISFIWENVVEEVMGKDKVEQILLKNVKTNAQSRLTCQGVFIFVGIKPNTVFLKEELKLDDAGFIITDSELMTSCEGIFACGDCRKKNLYQVITACAEGAQAAASAQRYLLNM